MGSLITLSCDFGILASPYSSLVASIIVASHKHKPRIAALRLAQLSTFSGRLRHQFDETAQGLIDTLRIGKILPSKVTRWRHIWLCG